MKWHEAILAVVVVAWLWRRLRKSDAPARRLSLPEAMLLGYRQAVEIAPNDAGAHRGLAQALCNLGRHEEALASFDRAAEIDPGPATDIGRGMALLRLGRHGDALGPLDRAAKACPGDADLHYYRGCALAGLAGAEAAGAELHARAMDEFREALRLDPGHHGAAAALESTRGRAVQAS